MVNLGSRVFPSTSLVRELVVRLSAPLLTSLLFADVTHWEWKTDVVQKHALLHQAPEAATQEEGGTRYRFWSRKV